jgi:hypothetical protein
LHKPLLVLEPPFRQGRWLRNTFRPIFRITHGYSPRSSLYSKRRLRAND